MICGAGRSMAIMSAIDFKPARFEVGVPWTGEPLGIALVMVLSSEVASYFLKS